MQLAVTSSAILSEISARIKQYRIDYPLTQRELSEKCGVSIRSISRFESGEDIQFSNLIKILKALELGENLYLLVPDMRERPSYHLEKEKPRKRATSSRNKGKEHTRWRWGDEQ